MNVPWHVKDTLCHHEAHPEEEIACWYKWENQEEQTHQDLPMSSPLQIRQNVS